MNDVYTQINKNETIQMEILMHSERNEASK